MRTTFLKNLGIATVLATMFFTTMPAAAGPKPTGAKPANPKVIAQIFSGKTWTWSKGGVYSKADGTAKAIWENSIGSGRWTVSSKGTYCRTMIWHWIGDGGKAGTEPKTSCNRHVVDAKGVIWQHNDKEDDWYRFNIEKKIKPGNKIKSAYRKIERKVARYKG